MTLHSKLPVTLLSLIFPSTVALLIMPGIPGISLETAFYDVLTSYCLFALLTIGIDKNYRFIDYFKTKKIKFFGIHILASIFISLIWGFSLKFILTEVIFSNQQYSLFFDSSFYFRLLSGILLYFMAIFSMTLTSFYEDYAIKMKNEAELINELTKAQLNSLKLQINPHFIFNSLNSVSALTAIDPSRAKSMIILLADYIRFSLTAGKNDFVSLNDEIENARKYIEIESIRFGSRINYNEYFEPFSSEIRVPPLIIQPLIENCIKHGVENTSETVNINFKIKNYGDMILISIENNFEDFSKLQLKEGVGLSNVRDRLKLHYDNINLVKVSSNNNLFVVELTLPVKI